jgi:hypothetical protein
MRIPGHCPHYSGMAIYRLTSSLVAFAPKEQSALTIPKGSLLKKDNYIPATGLTDVGWARRTVMVAVEDFLENTELFQ